jgi:hypothetical protein
MLFPDAVQREAMLRRSELTVGADLQCTPVMR